MDGCIDNPIEPILNQASVNKVGENLQLEKFTVWSTAIKCEQSYHF